MSDEEIIILMKAYGEQLNATGSTAGQVLPLANRIAALAEILAERLKKAAA